MGNKLHCVALNLLKKKKTPKNSHFPKSVLFKPQRVVLLPPVAAEGRAVEFLALLLCLRELQFFCCFLQSGQSLALDLGHSELDQLHSLHK